MNNNSTPLAVSTSSIIPSVWFHPLHPPWFLWAVSKIRGKGLFLARTSSMSLKSGHTAIDKNNRSFFWYLTDDFTPWVWWVLQPFEMTMKTHDKSHELHWSSVKSPYIFMLKSHEIAHGIAIETSNHGPLFMNHLSNHQKPIKSPCFFHQNTIKPH